MKKSQEKEGSNGIFTLGVIAGFVVSCVLFSFVSGLIYFMEQGPPKLCAEKNMTFTVPRACIKIVDGYAKESCQIYGNSFFGGYYLTHCEGEVKEKVKNGEDVKTDIP